MNYPSFFFFFMESLIAFTLSRVWRWTAAPGGPGGLSPLLGPVPAPIISRCMRAVHQDRSVLASFLVCNNDSMHAARDCLWYMVHADLGSFGANQTPFLESGDRF